ncbi:MAG TPA: hypothetical protein VFL64_15065 [Rhizobacter sp.]|nr:hypothetical protein [Rhizobacter sp.]
MDLKLPITITDELSDEVITSTGMLDLASGEIRSVEYEDYDASTQGLPAEREDYEFTSGALSNGKKEVEFGIQVNLATGAYSVTPNELLELKGRAAKLFTLAPGETTRPEAAGKKAPAATKRKPA